MRTAGAWCGRRALEHAGAGDELAARRPEQALVEDPLEARHADLRVGRHPERGELLAALGRDRAELADDLRRQQRGRGAVVALGQHGAVAGQQRGAGRHPRHAAQALAGREPGEDERARPVDAVAGGRQDDLAGDGAERARGDAYRHAVGAAVLARPGRVDLRRRRGLQRVLVGGGEARAGQVVAVVRRSARSTSPRSRRAPTPPRSARRAPGRRACGGRRRRGRRRRPGRTPPVRR